MEDNKRKDKAIYDSLASFLDDRSATPDGNAPQPEEEELQKLVFLWDECNPPEADTEGGGRKHFGRFRAREHRKSFALRNVRPSCLHGLWLRHR